MKSITRKFFDKFTIGPDEPISGPPPATVVTQADVNIVQPTRRYGVTRTLRQWSTPQLRAAKCLLRLHKANGAKFADAYDDIHQKLPWLPAHYEDLHGTPLTRDVVQHRFNTTKKKVRAWPQNNPYWPVARVLARLAGPISEARLLALVGQVARA